MATVSERIRWITAHLRVEPLLSSDARGGLARAGLVPLVPNPSQARLWALMDAQERRGLPVQIIVLKARRTGVSTAVQADYFARVNLGQHRRAKTIAHRSDGTATLFRMSRGFQDRMPRDALTTKASNAYEIVYRPPCSGMMRTDTAGAGGAVSRSEAIHYLHCSEFGWWPDPAKARLAATSCMVIEPGTAEIIESTANGIGGEFYDIWQTAAARHRRDPSDLTGFQPLFISWLDVPEYRLPIPEGFRWDYCPEEVMEDEPLLRQLGASDEQLHWRRRHISDKCAGDVKRFHQEMPSSDAEAFITSGRPAIAPSTIAYHRAQCRPFRKARFVVDPSVPSGVQMQVDEHLTEPCWHIWKTVEDHACYCLGADVCEGELATETDGESDADYSTGCVLERRAVEQVAEYRGQIEADLFGRELLLAACYYHQAWIALEANSPGLVPLLVLRRAHYPRIMQREGPIDKITSKPTMLDGWKTTTATRDPLLDQFLQHIRYDPSMGPPMATVRSHALVDEFSSFSWKKVGRRLRRQHRSGSHDDLVFGFALAIIAHLSCPMTLWTPQKARAIARRGRLPGHAWINGVDDDR